MTKLDELSAAAQIELWFFRDINDEARRKLIALCLGQKVADEAKFHNWQRKCLRRILNTRTNQLVERAGVVKALENALEDYKMAAVVPLSDPHIVMELRALCERAGYGNVMASTSALWRQALGDQAGGEFCAGPCRSTAEHGARLSETALTALGGDHGRG